MSLSAGQKKRFAREGYLTLPGAVPPGLVAAAQAEIRRRLDAGARRGRKAYPGAADYLSEHSSDPALMNLLHKTSLWTLAEALLGEGGIEPCTQAQIALRFPTTEKIRGSRNNGTLRLSCHIDSWEPDSDLKRISRHTLTIGVLLSDIPEHHMGNLCVFPGSHRLLARQVERHGLRSVHAALGSTAREVEPLQVTGKKGDAILLHYHLAHDKGVNFSAVTRFMAYFRLYHVDAWRDRSEPYLKKAMTDLWLEWPGMRKRGRAIRASESAKA